MNNPRFLKIVKYKNIFKFNMQYFQFQFKFNIFNFKENKGILDKLETNSKLTIRGTFLLRGELTNNP